MGINEVKTTIEGAFMPHRCVVEDYDYGYVKFRVTTQDGKLWTVADPDKAPTEKIWHGNAQAIREVVDHLRSTLRSKGYPLDDWIWPEE